MVGPVGGMDIDVYDADGSLMEATAVTDTNGFCCVGAFPPTNYTIRADPTAIEIAFLWTQLSGPGATIDDQTAPASSVSLSTSNEVYWFRLVVSDPIVSAAPVDISVVSGPMRITGMSKESNNVTIWWSLGYPPQPYTLLEATNLMSTNFWTNVIYSGSALEHTFVPTFTNRAFYRISGSN